MLAPLRMMVTLFIVGGVGAGTTLYFVPRFPRGSAGQLELPVPASSELPIYQLGSIQPAGGIVEVAIPTGLRPIRFEEGITLGRGVDQGAVLAYLEGNDERRKELAVIDAEIAAAESTLRSEDVNERVALDQIEAERRRSRGLGELQVEVLRRRIDLLRGKCAYSASQLRALEGLQGNLTISLQEYAQQKALVDGDRGELECMEAELRRAVQELSLNTSDEKVEEQRRKVKTAAERARNAIPLETLRRKKDLALAMLERTLVRAPISGMILEINTRPGETAVGKPLLKLGDTDQMYVVAEVYEEMRRLVQPGQRATITGRGLPDPETPLRGEVERVGMMVSGRKLMPLDLTAEANSHVFEVWIRLDPEDGARVRNYSLLRVDVEIDKRGGSTTETVR